MTNKALSNRAQKALDILERGGQFVERLERDNYTGREQFRTRLLINGSIVKGIGAATRRELSSMLRVLNGSTTVSTYYGLPYVHEIAQPRHF
jgi:hypothetical protein